MKHIAWIICVLLGLNIVPSALGQEPTSEPPEGFTKIELEDGDILFTFAYPESWATSEFEGPFPAVQFANDQDTLERDILGSNEPPVMEPGEFVVGIFLADQRQFANSDQLADDASIADMAAFAANGLEEIFEDVETCVFEAGERPAAIIQTSFAQDEAALDVLRIMVDMGMGENSREFADVVVLSAPGEADDYQEAFLGIVGSMEISEDGEARPLDDAESTAELPECEFETVEEDE